MADSITTGAKLAKKASVEKDLCTAHVLTCDDKASPPDFGDSSSDDDEWDEDDNAHENFRRHPMRRNLSEAQSFLDQKVLCLTMT